MPSAPFPRRLKRPDPKPQLGRLGLCLLPSISAVAVFGPVERLAMFDHPCCDVGAIRTPAVAYKTVVGIPRGEGASDRPRSGQESVECCRGVRAAPVAKTLGIFASLG